MFAAIGDCRSMAEKAVFPSARDALAVPGDRFLGFGIPPRKVDRDLVDQC